METLNYLCKCLNCDTTLIDENPQIGAIEKITPDNTQDMSRNDEGYCVCPNCGVDDYLIDL